MMSRIILILIFLIPAGFAIPRLVTAWYSRRLVYTIEAAPARGVAIVFGAGLWRDGSPTPVLYDRVATAAKLYFAGKVEKLLMSGTNRPDNDHRFASSKMAVDYNEPAAMRLLAMQLGVPDEAIVLDSAGSRTYDTCYRAHTIFGVSAAILVTQNFHLPRALYTCNALGISAVGVSADLRVYRRVSTFFWNLREVPATLVALWEVHLSHPRPVLGSPEPIFPPEAS
jgi:SanA protein